MISSISLILLISITSILCGDPSSTWLSYASYSAGSNNIITTLNATWKVPALPTDLYDSNAPGFWYGIQTADGNGSLIQPILAFADGNPVYTIFNGIYDWNDQSWYQSDSTTVYPNQTITASVTYEKSTNTYTMMTKCIETGWSVTSTKVVQGDQIESVAYFVVEHQPDSCSAYPANGVVSFYDIVLEVNKQLVKPNWVAQQEVPACDSTTEIIDYRTINISWNVNAPSIKNVESRDRFYY